MASITIRNLDDATKERLRLRAALNGRSMEEEVRLVLGELNNEPSTPATLPHSVSIASGSLAGRRILLIIGGGIAAYKCLDLIRRLRERGAKIRPKHRPRLLKNS